MWITENSAQAAGKAPARGAVEQTGAAPGAAQEATNCGKVSHELLIFRSAARTVLKSAAAKSQLKCNHCAYLMCVIATQPAPLSIHSSSTLRYTVTCLQFQLPLPFSLRLSPWHSGTPHARAQSHFILIAKQGDKKCALPVLKNWLLRK